MKTGIFYMVLFVIAAISFLGLVFLSFSTPEHEKKILNSCDGFTIIRVDGCEYINGTVLVHKGNCTNHAGVK